MIAAATLPATVGPENASLDEVCQQTVQHLLHEARTEFRELQIETKHGTVTMKGRVRSFYLRQIAIQCCQRASGVFHVNDQLQVGTA